MFLQASVILSTGGVCLSACWDTPPPGVEPPRLSSRHPPAAVHAGRYGQRAGGMHPTGMQSCIRMPLLRVPQCYIRQSQVTWSLACMLLNVFFTSRNEVLAKVIFSQACVILSTGGGWVSQHALQVSPGGELGGGGGLQFFGGVGGWGLGVGGWGVKGGTPQFFWGGIFFWFLLSLGIHPPGLDTGILLECILVLE